MRIGSTPFTSRAALAWNDFAVLIFEGEKLRNVRVNHIHKVMVQRGAYKTFPLNGVHIAAIVIANPLICISGYSAMLLGELQTLMEKS